MSSPSGRPSHWPVTSFTSPDITASNPYRCCHPHMPRCCSLKDSGDILPAGRGWEKMEASSKHQAVLVVGGSQRGKVAGMWRLLTSNCLTQTVKKG